MRFYIILMKCFTLFLALLFTPVIRVWSGEGMWIPLLADSLNLEEMQQKGCTLGAGEIYNINHASLKDAVVIFGGGCTGELISPDGLIITNYHCGYSRIQSHSTVEHNYLSDGFWAASRQDEMPDPGLTVTFLVRMEDVTIQALEGVSDSVSETERSSKVRINADRIEKNAIAGSHFVAEVKPFFFGRTYYLFVYEVFKDVRLVGAPPESIGRFGGDTDNWIWPRHTGDFSLFRIYADKDNQPAVYSPDNVPFKPRRYLNLSLDGIKEADFIMVLGYPGHTNEYLTSQGLQLISEKSLPAKVEMRTLRLSAMRTQMNKSPEARLRLASKYIGVSNSWKNWMGVIKGVQRSDAVNAKQEQEVEFTRWASGLSVKDPGYKSLFQEFRSTYDLYGPLYQANDLGNELLNSVELFALAHTLLSQSSSLADLSGSGIKPVLMKLRQAGMNLFRSGAIEVDKQILPELLRIYGENAAEQYQPTVYQSIRNDFNNDYQAYASQLFRSSLFTDSVKYKKLMMKSPGAILKAISTDPLPALYMEFTHTLDFDVYDRVDSLGLVLNRLYRKYISGLMEMSPGKSFYPDANFTMRVAFGQVEGYKAADAVKYACTTTLDGVMEKEDPEVSDYRVPAPLKEVFVNHDFGKWSVNGKIPVCFIASNHTSGGNSGSPVLNSAGELIGLHFDRNWEGTISDYAYNPAVCRSISLDIRYVLFIIDKVAHASWLLDELTLVHHP
jgi:hypothetical protein